MVPGEPVAVNLEGDRTYLRRIAIPETAQKQLAEVLPFELESELPFELEGAVYDTRCCVASPTTPMFRCSRWSRRPKTCVSASS